MAGAASEKCCGVEYVVVVVVCGVLFHFSRSLLRLFVRLDFERLVNREQIFNLHCTHNKTLIKEINCTYCTFSWKISTFYITKKKKLMQKKKHQYEKRSYTIIW